MKKLKTDMKMKKERWRFSSEVGAENTGSVVRVSRGNRAVVDGCRGIVDYYDDRIMLRTCDGSVLFTGQELSVENMTDRGAEIKGTIEKIEFTMKGRQSE